LQWELTSATPETWTGYNYQTVTSIVNPTTLAGLVAWYQSNLGVTLATPTVLDPNFTTGIGWTVGTDWAVGAGVATHTPGAASNISQQCLEVGPTYTITYTITAITAGTVTMAAGTNIGTPRNAPGTYSETLNCTGITDLIFAASDLCDASIDTVTVTTANVSTWEDQSVNGLDLFATGAEEPTLVGAELQFNGTSNLMHSVAFSLSQPLHAFVGVEWTGLNAGTNHFLLSSADSQGVFQTNGTATTVRTNVGAAGPTTTMVSGAGMILEVYLEGALSYLAVTGGAQTAYANAGTDLATILRLGAGTNSTLFAQANFYQLAVYDRRLPADERAALITYMRTYQGI
jgi:hypothetical protein